MHPHDFKYLFVSGLFEHRIVSRPEDFDLCTCPTSRARHATLFPSLPIIQERGSHRDGITYIQFLSTAVNFHGVFSTSFLTSFPPAVFFAASLVETPTDYKFVYSFRY